MFLTATRIEALRQNLGHDLIQFLPELVLCAGIVFLLLARLVKALDRVHLGVIAVAALVAATLFSAQSFVDAAGWQNAVPTPAVPYFAGMLAADTFASFARTLLAAAALLVVLLTRLTGLPDRTDSADFYTLLLGGTLGMMLMASANHLLMVYIAIEMASLPSYALAGFLKGRQRGSEAALKYVVFGAGASGVMLYGISLIAGTIGTGCLPDVADRVAAQFALQGALDPSILTGLTLLLVGFGFKLAAVPFQFWCPDVFEGAAAEVAGFLSVASKAAAIALTVRVLFTLQAACADIAMPWVLPGTFGIGVGVVGALTATFGNLAAFRQTNLKRLLAYSTIAHAGYMLLGVALLTPAAASAVLYYLVAYIPMNLGAFAVVALVRNATGSEELPAFRGLAWRSPLAAVAMTVFLFSLLGFPPLAGFAGKFQVFAAVFDGGKAATAAGHAGLGTAFYVLLGIGALNTAASAYYYLRVVRAMTLEAAEGPSVSAGGLYLSAFTALVVAIGIVWNPITAAADRAAVTFAPHAAPTTTETR